MDKLRQKTDKELAKLEKKLDSVYRQAEKDIAEKWDAYMKKAAEKLEPLEKAYADAKASGDKEAIAQTGKALGQEKFRQTLQNARFKDMLDETTEKIADVNKIALSYINDEQPKVYSNNYNGTLKEVKNDIKGLNTGVKFNMVDERTVKELARKKDLLYSQKTLNRAKDKKWNLKALTSQVTQGILQGESVPDIAKRLAAVSDMNRTSCIRNARTMTTTSENSGRLAGLKEAEEKGIVYEKQWMATNDDRTRESHAELDGVSVPVDDPFPNGLMYPGDMSGDAEEVYNCRCSMVRNLIGFRSTDGDVVDVGDIERYERRTPAAAKTEKPTEIAEEPAPEIEVNGASYNLGDKVDLPVWGQGTIVEIDKNANTITIDTGDEITGQVKLHSNILEHDKSGKQTAAEQTTEIIAPETKAIPPLQDTQEVLETLEENVKKDFVPIESPTIFNDSKSADEYFRGTARESKMGGANIRRGYGITEDANKPATKWEKKLNTNQKNAIFEYTGDQYKPVNNYLRGIWDEKEAKEQYVGNQSLKGLIKNIDGAINKFDLKEPIVVHRSCEADFLEKIKVGGVFHDEGYGSASVIDLGQSRGIVHFEVTVPAGKGNGAYIDGLSAYEGAEFEFLINRGADYYVESIENTGGGINVKATITGFTRKD